MNSRVTLVISLSFCLVILSCKPGDSITNVTNMTNDSGSANTVDLTNGLVAYYPFSGNANDASGNSFNGTVIGATLSYDRFGQLNSAYYFNGTTAYIRFGDILDSVFCKPVAKFSVSAWVKTKVAGTTSSGGGFIIGKVGGGNPGPYQWNIAHLDTRLFGLVCSDSLAQNYINRTNPVNAGQWYHFVLVFDGSLQQEDRIRIYINGTSNMSTYGQVGSLGTSTVNTSQEMTIGAGHASGNPTMPNNLFNGTVDDVRIYNKALTIKDVLALYAE